MLQFIQIHHRFGPNILFENFSWHIKPGSKIGLVGPNGVGKTTLFQIATNKLVPDSGSVVSSKHTAISLFQQIPQFQSEKAVIPTVLESLPAYHHFITQQKKIQQELNTLAPESDEYHNLLDRQAALEEQGVANGVYDFEVQAKKLLSGLGLQEEDFLKAVGTFSPGFQHRIALAISLLKPHNLLLLDEPTNHLDDRSKAWLVEYLQSTSANFILVTHDPDFLNQSINMIAEVSKKGVIEFRGTLEAFLQEQNEIHAKLQAQYAKEEAFLKKRTEWIERFRSKATKARQVQSAIKKLAKRDKLESADEIFWNREPNYHFTYQSSGKVILRLENCSFQYPESEPIFAGVDLEICPGDRVAVVGRNGAGKSTLMRCLAGQLEFAEGNQYMGPRTIVSYFNQVHAEVLDDSLSIYETIQISFPYYSDREIRSLLGHFSFSEESVHKQVHAMSGGEKSRLRLAMMVPRPCNCLLLDEPTNHLDLVTRNAFQNALANFAGASIIISHDPEFLRGLCNKTYRVLDGRFEDLNCSFADYLQYHQEFQRQTEKTEKKKQDGRSSQDPLKKRKKRLEKGIAQLEEKMDDLEEKKSQLEQKIAGPDFYSLSNYSTILQQYDALKKEIEQTFAKWEELSMELESL